MADVLSQSQIDALLNSMSDGDGDKPVEAETKTAEEKKTYRKYNFYSPKKFTTDKLKQINGVYESFARIVSSQLNSILRMSVEIEVLSVEEQRYHEYANALSENDIMMLSDIKLPDGSKNPPILTHINQVVMVNIIDRMLGGIGNDRDIDSYYTYTDLELALYRKAMDYIIMPTRDAWANYVNFEISDPRMEENPTLFQEIRFDEPVAIVMLSCIVQGVEGRISICIPGSLLTSIFTVVDRRKNKERFYENVTGEEKKYIISKMKKSSLTMSADFGTAQLDVRDVCSMKVGDVIALNKPKDSNILLYVEGEPWFEGKIGVHNKNVAVKIDKRISTKIVGEDNQDNEVSPEDAVNDISERENDYEDVSIN